ncbi:MAG: replication-associated recombination protein A [Phycisphaeraceae bacterium]|nr:replication-associated recombination protein A [Phycisphaeraceae bacterium]MCW5762056.1 replication-associated recombination protein A [Phycisphaeraceae bacterium]
MSDLWASSREKVRRGVEPLAVRMRPRTIDEFVGQGQILGEGKLLRRMIQADAITSLILHGPAGTGKTTLAEVIAGATRRRFVRENAASVGVKRVREVIDEATGALESTGVRTILFLDEIHRFSKAQQDVLLGDVERGLITLIGATTENPLFAVNSALISRSTLFRLESLGTEEIARVVRLAIADRERGYGSLDLTVTDEAVEVWAIKSEGDARRALTALEVAVLSCQKQGRASDAAIVIDKQIAEESIQEKVAVYGDDGHYDAASAMIKSVRGSDPDAALYWIARMLEAGEDPRFIARRLAILASEDIGNADPRAIVIAEACWSLCERIGMPECRITLGQTAVYLALAPKSNASYVAIEAAIADVREGRVLPVPMHLRDPNSSPIADESGKGVKMRKREGEKYEYSHKVAGKVTGQDYLGVAKRYFEPTEEGAERILKQRLIEIRQLRERRQQDEPEQTDEG